MNRFKAFISYYKPYRALLAADLFFAFLGSGTVLCYPILVNRITREAISVGSVDTSLVMQTALIFLFLMAVEYISNYFISAWGHMMGAKMEFDMRNRLFQHFQKLSFRYYDNAKTGQLMSRLTNDLFDVTELAHHGPEDIFISIVKIFGSFIILFQINRTLTTCIFLVLPFMLLFCIHYNRKMKRAFKKNRERIADINSQVEDSLSGVRVVKSFANEEWEFHKFTEGNQLFVESKRTSYRYMALFHSGLAAFTSFITILTVVMGSVFIQRQYLGLPELLTFLLYINTLIDPVKKLMNFTEQFQNGATGFERFMEILAIDPDIADVTDARPITNVRGLVEFTGVSFRYSNELDFVLRGLNLRAEPGEYIALVGSSGVGKTTLCSLIPRFYEVTEGMISLDGQDIRTVTLKSLREAVGIVQQDVYLFTGTIKDNIRYGKPSATDEEIIRAAKNANAHDFIEKLPDGYDSYVGQRGVKLSGGQKQRISIARVFLKNPAVLIFDEATSALDNESEQVVQESFERLAKNRTTFVIAHRLSTIRNAKRIIVLGDDGIIEEGSHQELLNRDGAYAKLYNLQFPSSLPCV